MLDVAVNISCSTSSGCYILRDLQVCDYCSNKLNR